MSKFEKYLEMLSESFAIERTKPDGSKDLFAGGFDTIEQAEKELEELLKHPLHTKHNHKFKIIKK